MSKIEFFTQLRDRLRGLPYEEQERILQVYEELFAKAEANGKSEREIVESLGYVPQLSETGNAGKPKHKGALESSIRVVVASIALSLFNLIFIVGPAAGIAAALISLNIAAVALALGPVWVLLGTGIPNSMAMLLLEIFGSAALTGVGILLGIGMWKVNRGFRKLIVRYVRMNMKLIKGE